jgi:hypothetical protein
MPLPDAGAPISGVVVAKSNTTSAAKAGAAESAVNDVAAKRIEIGVIFIRRLLSINPPAHTLNERTSLLDAL